MKLVPRGALDAAAAPGNAARAPTRPAVDLRAAFAFERWTAPALVATAAFAAFAGADAAPTLAVLWLAASAGNTAARCLLALRAGAARPTAPWQGAARLYALSWTIELALWALLFLGLVPAAALVQGWIAVAAAALHLFAALTLARWPAAWSAWIAGWALLAALAAARVAAAELPALPFALGAAAWLGAIGWFGRVQQRPPGAAARRRADWKAVVQAVPTPLIVLRAGRVAAVNPAAAQLLGAAREALVGRRLDELLRAEPAHVLDPLAGDRSVRSLRAAPLAAGGAGDAPTWPARARVLNPGRADSAVMLALLPQPGSADGFAEDARRLIAWFGAHGGQPWYRDEAGRVVLPPSFDSAQPVDAAGDAFPLAPWVLPAERAAVEADYARALAAGRVFDRVAHLVDRDGQARRLRLTCLTRATAGAAARAPVIGMLAPVADGDGAAAAEWLEALPVLVWWVDASGIVERVHGGEGWRWGMQCADDATGVRWDEALSFDGDGRATVLGALRQALGGQPSFDLVNIRVTRRGAKLALRSHFVPFAGRRGQPGVLVTDTVASPRELSAIDRLRRARNYYKELAESSTNLIWACDAELVFTYVSRRAAREIYGREQAELIGQPLASLIAEGPEAAAAREALAGLRARRELRSVEMVQRGRDGARAIVAVDAVPLAAGDGVFAGAIGVHTDLTALKQRERRLVEALRIERTVLDAAGQAIAVVRGERVTRCNEAFLHLVQIAPAALLHTPVGEFFASADDWPALAAAADQGRVQDHAASRELQVQRGGRAAAKGAMWCQITARWIAAGEYVLVLADIDRIRHREALALHHANHDELTGLPNRRLLAARGKLALSESGLHGGAPCAVFAIDLDGFKGINDRYGHDRGDCVLREVAERLRRLLRPQDTVARRGGDEFTMLLPDVRDRADIERIAQRLLAAIAQPVDLGEGISAQLSASVGIAVAPDHGDELDHLLHLADLAMYEAKLKGKNGHAFARAPQPAADEPQDRQHPA